ncbi:MAG: KH domain-containing protein [Butyrivibrio sp.]|nr:KH domain-containing protein [Butyrivibrio sp.]
MRMRMPKEQQPKKKRHQHPPKKNRPLDESLQQMPAFEEDPEYDPEGIMDIDATIICEKDSHKGIVIGKGGSMLKKIGSAARKDIEEMVGCQVNLQLFVKVRRDWRDDRFQMKNFGYDYKDLK